MVADSKYMLHVHGRTLHVAVRKGEGTLPPLLLLNGIGAPLPLLQPFVDALDPAREVIRLDVPGVGESPAPKIPYSMGTMALSVARILDQLEYRKVDVMGFSWGGALAQHLAVQHRNRVLANGQALQVVHARNLVEEHAHQRRHVFPSLAQRAHVQRHDR